MRATTSVAVPSLEGSKARQLTLNVSNQGNDVTCQITNCTSYWVYKAFTDPSRRKHLSSKRARFSSCEVYTLSVFPYFHGRDIPEEVADEISEIDPLVGREVERQLSAVPDGVSDSGWRHGKAHHWYSASTTCIGNPFCMTFSWQSMSACCSSRSLSRSRL